MGSSQMWNVSLPPSLAKAAEAAAKREAKTKSELVREALRQYLWTSRWRSLRRYGEVQARAKGLTEADIERLIDELRA